MRRNPARPLSPHLSIWKWGPHMAVSIAHRATGDGMALVGSVLLVWFLLALAGGPESYDQFLFFATSPLGTIIAILLSWALFQHMASGVRHLFLDTGAGFELKANRNGSIGVFLFSVLATVALWSAIFGGLI